MTKASCQPPQCPQRVRLTPRRGVRDRDIHLVDPCQLSGRQLVLRRQQSNETILAAFGGPGRLALALASYAAQHPLPDNGGAQRLAEAQALMQKGRRP